MRDTVEDRAGAGGCGWWSRRGCRAFGYLFAHYPNVPPAEDVKVAATPERLARGEYLVEHVVGCVVCHAERDFDKYTGPVRRRAPQGAGGAAVRLSASSRSCSIRRTSRRRRIGEWTDGELIRAITAGVSQDGTPLFPLMPYPHYAQDGA